MALKDIIQKAKFGLAGAALVGSVGFGSLESRALADYSLDQKPSLEQITSEDSIKDFKDYLEINASCLQTKFQKKSGEASAAAGVGLESATSALFKSILDSNGHIAETIYALCQDIVGVENESAASKIFPVIAQDVLSQYNNRNQQLSLTK